MSIDRAGSTDGNGDIVIGVLTFGLVSMLGASQRHKHLEVGPLIPIGQTHTAVTRGVLGRDDFGFFLNFNTGKQILPCVIET